MKVKDIDIRKPLHKKILNNVSESDTLILDELVVCHGKARVDVAVINGLMIGFEIKSECDDLKRLPNQIKAYNKVFDNITLVTSECHLDKAESIVPEWWGIKVTTFTQGHNIKLSSYRQPKQNNKIEPFELVKFLLKDELVYLIEEYALEKKYKRYPKFEIWPYIAENIPLEELKTYVRNRLKIRKS